MKFYHGTTKKVWKEIQKEGVLWGRKNQYWGKYPDGSWKQNDEGIGHKMQRITWFARDFKDAGIYDDKGLTSKQAVILEIAFPEIKEWNDWQMTCYEPIPIDKVKRVL